jgi:hypothetical protein
MALAVKEDEPPHPLALRRLRPVAVMLEPQYAPHLVEKFRLARFVFAGKDVRHGFAIPHAQTGAQPL